MRFTIQIDSPMYTFDEREARDLVEAVRQYAEDYATQLIVQKAEVLTQAHVK